VVVQLNRAQRHLLLVVQRHLLVAAQLSRAQRLLLLVQRHLLVVVQPSRAVVQRHLLLLLLLLAVAVALPKLVAPLAPPSKTH